MKHIVCFFALFALIFTTALFPQTGPFYVDPVNGKDTNPGSLALPFLSIPAGLTAVGNGGTLYLRGGLYDMGTTPLYLTANGSATNYINVFAYPGEIPILDFSKEGTKIDGISLSGTYYHLKGIEERYATHFGIYIAGSNNIIENCTFHHNVWAGLNIGKQTNPTNVSNTLVKNCDSYMNYDAPIGGNADGFAAKYGMGTGNRFVGCRAWNNSDDGWDFWVATSPIIIDSCFAFRNGIDSWFSGSFNGNGNGFKLGGNSIPARHIVRNCVAFDNAIGAPGAGRGYDQNNNTDGQTLYNCVAYRNKGDNFHFSNPVNSGEQHTFKNCIALPAVNSFKNNVDEKNSWNGFTPSEADFLSVDTALALAPRNADGSLPNNAFFRLALNSQFIDAGVNVGIPFFGTAPDIGAFEYTGPNDSKLPVNRDKGFNLQQNYPNPFNPSTVINYELATGGKTQLKVYNVLGNEIATLVNEEKPAGRYQVAFGKGAEENLASGCYFYRLTSGTYTEVRKMLLVK